MGGEAECRLKAQGTEEGRCAGGWCVRFVMGQLMFQRSVRFIRGVKIPEPQAAGTGGGMGGGMGGGRADSRQIYMELFSGFNSKVMMVQKTLQLIT